MFSMFQLIRSALCATSLCTLHTSPVSADIPDVDLILSEEGFLLVDELPPLDAFTQLAHAMALTYPLTDWKSLDWNARFDEVLPQMQEAVQAGDEIAYYRLVREFVCSAPDGHVSIYSLENGSDALAPSAAVDGMDGAFGFVAMPGRDGHTRLLVLPGSAAADAGIETGSELLTVNGEPIEAALAAAPTAWTNGGIATVEAEQYFQGIALGRARPGVAVTLTCRTPGASGAMTAHHLVARPATGLPLPGLDRYLEAESDLLDAALIDPATGYIRLSAFYSSEIETDADEAVFMETVANEFAATLEQLEAAGAERLILDLRGNIGGLDELGARLAGYFRSDSALYQTSVPFDLETGWTDDPADFELLFTAGAAPHFDGRVILLANHTTTSAAETFVQHLQGLPQVRYVGHWATNGSNANMGGLALLPGGILVLWPIEPCLDETGQIRIDTTAARQPRLQPDVRVPLGPDELEALLDPDRDVEVEWAIATLDDPLFGYFPGLQKSAQGWAWHPQFGWLWTESNPWVYHLKLGWLYLYGRGGEEQDFYSNRFGWCYSAAGLLPHFYSWKNGWFYLRGKSLWSYEREDWVE